MIVFETILGYQVVGSKIDDLYREVVRIIDNYEKFYICCLNPHSHTVSLKDRTFQEALLNSRFNIPDGIGIKLASKIFLEGRISETIPGPDFLGYFCHKSVLEEKNYRHFFLGSTTDTLEKLKINLKQSYGIKIVDTYSPPFKESFTLDDNTKIIEAINKAEADILWVGLTSPKQDKWIYKNLGDLNIKMAMGVGAAFDFYAGTVKRAPHIIRMLGLEGYHRLVVSPSAIYKRALFTDLLFVYHVIIAFIKRGMKRENLPRN